MLFTTVGQGWVFVGMLFGGMAVGLWYALTALLRRVLRAGFWLSLACDALFGAGAAAILCAALVLADYGRVRLYALLAAALGFALFAAGSFSALHRAARRCRGWLCRSFVTLRRFRWINVIFR